MLVPTPNRTPNNVRPSLPVFKSIYTSFYDAPDGLTEELHEIAYILGFDQKIIYRNNFKFAARLGYLNEHETKGNRKMASAGIGLGFKGFTLDVAYTQHLNFDFSSYSGSIGYTRSF